MSVRSYVEIMQPFSDRNVPLLAAAYDEISKKDDVENFVFSPFALETIVALVYLGARGETAEQLRLALGYKPSSEKSILSEYRKVLHSLRDEATGFRMGNSIFVTNNHELRPGFRRAADRAFHSQVGSINFANPVEALASIRIHLRDLNEADIQNLIEEEDINETTRIIMGTFTKFRAFWNSVFDVHLRITIEYHEDSKKPPVYVPGMFKYWFYPYFEHPTLNCVIVEMYFLGSDISLTIALPNEVEGLPDLEQHIDEVVRVDHPFSKRYLSLNFPMFKIDNKLNYKEVLERLGVEKAFSENQADFARIAGNLGDLRIEEVIQRAVVDFALSGCNTTGLVSPINGTNLHEYDNFPVDEQPMPLQIDHPFIFYIRIKDLVVFVGRVVRLEGDTDD